MCVPTLNRYDLLGKLIADLQASDRKPDHIYVIDNGGRWILDEHVHFLDDWGIQHHYWRPGINLGVASSWNWFLQHADGIKIISNDDIGFRPDTISRLLAAYRDDTMICPASIIGGNAFSCFILPDRIVTEVGYFDETISPGWAYFEDGDMWYRMTLAGFSIKPVDDCLVDHQKSSTLNALDVNTRAAHHARFQKAESNYRAKWGGLPHHETFTTPYNRG